MDEQAFKDSMKTAVLLESTRLKDEVIISSEEVRSLLSSTMCPSKCLENVTCVQIEESTDDCCKKLQHDNISIGKTMLKESHTRNRVLSLHALEIDTGDKSAIDERTSHQKIECCTLSLNDEGIVETVDRVSQNKSSKVLKPLAVKECKKKRKTLKSTKKRTKRHECNSNSSSMQEEENEVGKFLEDEEGSGDSHICQNKEKETLLQTLKKESKKNKSLVKKTKHKNYEKPSDQILKVYQCTQCPKVFQRVSNFNAHQRKHTALKSKPFSCQDCMSTFSYRFQLTQHVRIHTGERPFQCHTCKKTFARKGCLVAHMVTHTDSLPYQCDVCNRRFARKYNLSKHIESHSTERPHCCLECSRRFKCKQSLEKHLRIHQLSIYACTICHQSFDTKRRLTNHTLNEHVSYRPFTCQICNKPFIFKSQLTYHIKEHELERPYSCAKCKKSYFKKGHLLSHIKQYCNDDVADSEVKSEVAL